MQALHSCQSRVLRPATHLPQTQRPRPVVAAAAAKKGFGTASKQAPPQQQQQPSQDTPAAAEPAAVVSTAADPSKEDEIESLLRRRKNRRVVEPKVKVESAAVDMATGKLPANAVGEAETRVVQALALFFLVLLIEGLLLAGAGFLPGDWDAFIKDALYPSYSPQMLLFLGMSSAYGLWKTGKLPGQQQMK